MMQHLGDITKLNGAIIEPVWCVTGGSPCQDLSIAGKRAGLAGARSGLFMEQIRVIKEMREHDKRLGRAGELIRPRYMVWENVPGAFSSNKGKDFAAVLEEIIKIVEPEAPGIEVPEKGWPTWGGYHDEVGGRWSVAWRTHDAQYWGVPQRRRRISVVADFGGDTAGEILFERKSVSGHPAESGTARERLAGDAERGFNPAVRDVTTYCLQGNVIDRADTAGCNGKGWREDASYTLNTVDRPAVVAHAVELDMTHACDVIRECGEQVPALQARMGTCGNQVPLTYGIGNGQANEASIMAEEVSQTLNTMHDAQAILYQPKSAMEENWAESETKNALRAGESKVSHAVVCEDISHTLRAKAGCAYREDAETYICSAVDCWNGKESDVGGTLQARTGHTLNANGVVRSNMVVRRLTPLECERLQGFPDGWTDIGDYTDSTGKKRKTSDSARYKALGNSIALPFWRWMFCRMAAYLPEGATLGSLFDGIGGFPLCWENIHGAGTAIWASEIEEFPIAVAKLRFGGAIT